MRKSSTFRRQFAADHGAEQPLVGKTFVLGVGAQKAGTSWLYGYLDTHPDCRMPRTKELHVFDAALQPATYGFFASDTAKRLLDLLDRQEDPDGAIRPDARLRETRRIAAAQQDPARYPAIFAELPAGARITGDITPSYAALSAAQFMRIRKLLVGAGARPRVVFLMRDPVERVYSSARMWARRTGVTDTAEIHAALIRHLGDKAHKGRARYDRTITALEAAFPAEELHFGFYETLFTDTAIGRLCAFLGITPVAADFERRVNVTQRPGDLPAPVLAQARAALDPVYSFCRARFGADVPESWLE